jgi:hypothetical protein
MDVWGFGGRGWIGIEKLKEYAEDSQLRFAGSPDIAVDSEDALPDSTLQSKLL